MADLDKPPVPLAADPSPGTSTSGRSVIDGKDATGSEAATPPTTASAPRPAWTKHYDSIKTSFPPSISAHIPSSSTAAATVDQVQSRLTALSATSASQLGELQRSGSQRLGKLKENTALVGVQKRLSPDQFLSKAYAIRNDTQIALNVSLNQVGPLMYQVLLPNDTFERRVPNVWYNIEIRPYTSSDTAYTPWSVSWPIIAITGPIVAATSLLLIPIVALAAGGTALATLTGFGSTVVEGAAAATAGAGSAVATAGGVAAKLAHLPGGSKIKGKLVDAAKENLGKGQKVVTEQVVRYLGKGTAAAAVGGAIAGGEAKDEDDRGRKASRQWEKKKLDEVEVTGLNIEDVLKCATGKKRTDRSLSDAFKRLNKKVKEYKTKNNPVLRIVGGPELEERGKHTYLVFYPFRVEPFNDVEAEPIPTTEVPPTAAESTLIRDALVVDSVSDAEEVSKRAPVYADGSDEKKRIEAKELVKDIEAKKGEGAKASGGSWFGWGK